MEGATGATRLKKSTFCPSSSGTVCTPAGARRAAAASTVSGTHNSTVPVSAARMLMEPSASTAHTRAGSHTPPESHKLKSTSRPMHASLKRDTGAGAVNASTDGRAELISFSWERGSTFHITEFARHREK